MVQNDDTQPRSPFQGQTPEVAQAYPTPTTPPPTERSGGPGCLVWGLVGLIGIACSVLVVGLATYIAWNDGLKVAQANATASVVAQYDEQCQRIASELSGTSANLALLERRFAFLMTQTPAVSCISQYAPTATALYFSSLPTATPTATNTPTPTPTTVEPTQVIVTEPVQVQATLEPTSPFDLEALLLEARGSITLNEWEDAIKTLDAIVAIEPNYQEGVVKRLLFDALTAQANIYYHDPSTLAQAIVLTDRAEEFGDIQGLNYERFIASLYLDAQRYVNLNYPEAIRLLGRIVYEQNLPNYQEGEASRLLFTQYVGYADAFGFGGEYCKAVEQYDRALSLRVDSSVTTKRDNAVTQCALATSQAPTAGFTDPTLPTPTIAPVGSQN